MGTGIDVALKNAIISFNQYLRNVNPTEGYADIDYRNAFLQRLKQFMKYTSYCHVLDKIGHQNIEICYDKGWVTYLKFINRNSYYGNPMIKDLQHFSESLNFEHLKTEIIPYSDKLDDIVSNINFFSWKTTKI